MRRALWTKRLLIRAVKPPPPHDFMSLCPKALSVFGVYPFFMSSAPSELQNRDHEVALNVREYLLICQAQVPASISLQIKVWNFSLGLGLQGWSILLCFLRDICTQSLMRGREHQVVRPSG